MFQKSVLKNFTQDESLVATRWAEYQKYLTKIDYVKKVKEEKYQDGFLKDIFENCLGYTLDSTDPANFNLEREKKNETDGKKADGVIYVDGIIVGIIELKAQDTKNLDKIEIQAFNYHNSHSNSKYVIISNFDELRFYIDKKIVYEKFNLFTLSYDDFKRLHLLLSYESIKNDTPLKIKEKSSSFEQNISKELYKDFSLFRMHLFENLVKNNSAIDKTQLLRLTQKLCDRIIFILFAEDRDLLTPNTIKQIRERHKTDIVGFGMYEYYKIYFKGINESNAKLGIPKYNGGLFATDEALDNLIIDDNILDIEAQKLSDYDFESDISVNILGHIFEQSLTDLEELQASIDDTDFDNKKSKRKKDGVFYTPEYITKYIVDNTLGKLCEEKKEELNLLDIQTPKNPKKLLKAEQKILKNIYTYRDYLSNLKILDPACGSGAFLNQALEFLITEHKYIDENRRVYENEGLSLYDMKSDILKNNLYGVDINEDAVEIAKLSLWIRTATRESELVKLADKIKCGNSLINDKSVVDNAFVWEDEFKEVFDGGGFDVVIGNPPYVNIANISNEIYRNYLRDKFKVAKNKSDLYSFFVEKSVSVLKTNGLLGFIISNSWLGTDSFSEFRKFLLTEVTLLELTKLSNKTFEDAIVTPINIFLEKSLTTKHTIKLSHYKNETFSELNYRIAVVDVLNSYNYTISLDEKISFRVNTIKLDEISKFSLGIKTSNDKRFILDTKIDNYCYPMLRGRQISRYSNEKSTEYIWYKPKLMLEKKGAGVRKLEYFNTPKILIQDIAQNINATYDDKDILTNDTISILYETKDTFSIKYLLAVLNAKLINNWYKNTFQSGLHIKINHLKQVPIVKINEDEQLLFCIKVDLILQLNSTLKETKQNFINELELEKIPKKLQNFEELDFDTFVKEYTKAKKLKFSDKLEERNFKNEWKSLFENDSKIALDLKSKIDTTDKKIDNMVYELYGLSEDEIKIIEGNV